MTRKLLAKFDNERVHLKLGASAPHEGDRVGSEREGRLPLEPAGGFAELVHVLRLHERVRAQDAEARRRRSRRRRGIRCASSIASVNVARLVGFVAHRHLVQAREALFAVNRAREQQTPRTHLILLLLLLLLLLLRYDICQRRSLRFYYVRLRTIREVPRLLPAHSLHECEIEKAIQMHVLVRVDESAYQLVFQKSREIVGLRRVVTGAQRELIDVDRGAEFRRVQRAKPDIPPVSLQIGIK